jgi:hypothetical protein
VITSGVPGTTWALPSVSCGGVTVKDCEAEYPYADELAVTVVEPLAALGTTKLTLK